jgi:hypothetical protein
MRRGIMVILTIMRRAPVSLMITIISLMRVLYLVQLVSRPALSSPVPARHLVRVRVKP